jgi:hypothetical protein
VLNVAPSASPLIRVRSAYRLTFNRTTAGVDWPAALALNGRSPSLASAGMATFNWYRPGETSPANGTVATVFPTRTTGAGVVDPLCTGEPGTTFAVVFPTRSRRSGWSRPAWRATTCPVRMYEPHEAREDTVLSPAFRKIVSKHEADALGEDFEKKENQIFHGDGFEKNVDAVAKWEKELGIYDLAQFTPKI